MRPTIVFGILSAAHRPETLQQLVQALADYPVVIHHDFSQQPDFPVRAPNVTFVADYVSSGWASWGLMDSMARTIQFCGQHYDYDYLQFLTPVDLPIKPLADFEASVVANDHDVAVETLAMDTDELVFMTFAFRAYAAEDSLAYRLLWRAREAYFGADYRTVVRGGLSVPTDASRGASGKLTTAARIGRALTRSYVGLVQRFGNPVMRTPVLAGSAWFGAESDFRRRPGNHFISEFDGPRPLWLGPEDFDTLLASDRFFARKFPDDPAASIRTQILAEISNDTSVKCVA